MNKKIITTLLLVVFLSVIMPIVSAQMDFDNIKGDLIIDETTSKYGRIEIKDWFGLQSLAKIEPMKNTDKCGWQCSAEIEIIMYQDSVLIDDVKFIGGAVKSYNFYIKTGEKEITIEDYNRVCETKSTLNATKYKVCEIKKTGSHNEIENIYESYKLGTEVKAGTYYIKLEGTKDLGVTTDWQIITQGKLLNEFLEWGSGGDGTLDNPYQIYNWTQMNMVDDNLTASYILMNNLNLSTPGYIDVASSTANAGAGFISAGSFIGIFDGNGKTISDFVIYRPTNNNLGLFSQCQTSCIIKNLKITNASVTGTDTSAILAGYLNEGGTILNVSVQGNLTGLDGYNGGICGQCNSGSIINDSYANVRVTSANAGGGLGGGAFTNTMVGNSYAVGFVSGAGTVGGLFAEGSANIIISNSFWDNQTTGQASSYGGGTAKTTAQMKNLTTFTNAGWDIIDYSSYAGETWFMNGTADYPRLWYEYVTSPSIVTTTLNSPVNYYNSTLKSITFNCSATTTIGTISNISLWLNTTGTWLLNETITGSSLQVIKNISDGINWGWTCRAYDNSTTSAWGTNRTLSVDTILPLISANILNPVVYVPSDNVTVNYTITDVNLASCWYNYNSINVSFSCLSGINNVTNITSVSPNTIIMLYANDTIGNRANYTLNFSYDTTPPSITINEPQSLETYGYTGKSQTLNWSVSDDYSLNKIWYNYNGTNITLYGLSNSTNFTLKNHPFNLTFYANDSVGNLGTKFWDWDYKIFELNQSYSNATTEGNLVNFFAYVIVNETVEISSAVLHYNNTIYSGSISNLASYSITYKNNLLTPEISANTTFPFYWTLTLDDSTIINLTTYNQTVYNLLLDNCTSYGNKLFNLTIKDEKLQTNLINATLEIAINLYTSNGSTLLISLGAKYENQNPVAICSNLNLSGTDYYMETIMKYYATDYAQEYYVIETSDFTPQNISLYDLNSTDSTAFKLTFTGIDFLPEEGVLVYVERQYISENTFKTVELPKTDTNGQTVIHLVRNDVIYNLIFIKDGVVLRRFENLRAFCDDYSIGDCQINLNALSTADDVFTYDDEFGIIFDNPPTYNSTTNIVSFSYVSDDGTIKNVTMTVERRDVFGNNSLCSNSLTSVSGTVSCNIGTGISDTSVVTTIQVDGQTWISTSVQIDTTAYGGIGYVAWFLLALGLVFMFSKDKNGILIALLLSYVGAVSMGWVLGGIAGLGSAGIWILIITAVGLWRLNKNKLS